MPSLSKSVVAGVSSAARKFGGPVVLMGHSATYAVTRGSELASSLRRQVQRVISVSGLHDLRPTVKTERLNAALRLSEDLAASLSPALCLPDWRGDLVCLVGAGELPELKRQTHLLANVWAISVIATCSVELPGEHHFSVLESLHGPTMALTRWATLEE